MNNSTNQSLLAETDSSLIRAELERLLSNRRFSGARQMSAFLRYIVSETLDGNSNRIKAYTVGVDALGKADDFDAQTDPSVRVLALRLRKSLEAAYADKPECHAVIVMTVGSYVPQFYKPHAFVSSGDAEKSLEPGGTSVAGSAQVTSGESTGTSLDSDKRNSMTAMLHERFGVIMALTVLAAAWQVSVKNVSAATVSIGGGAPQAEVSTFSPVDLRAGNPPANALKTPVVTLPSCS